MPRYRIVNPASGLVLGDYYGHTEAEALDDLAHVAGYDSYRAACEVTGDDPDRPDLIITRIPADPE